jgi:ubiquinone/menaquinone biosynthesis C-methylase UbiE
MFGKIFLGFTRFPGFRRVIWKPIYELLARVMPNDDWRFMNYGYEPMPGEASLPLEDVDEPDRYPLQLYHYLAVLTPLEGRDMLEVGSGRGGGSYYIARYLGPKSVTGLDLAFAAVAFAGRNWRHPNLRYVQGDAERLPFGDGSFDVVINVESSHAYGSFPTFLSEVRRVLRPGGVFLITDMRTPNAMRDMMMDLKQSGMIVDLEDDITVQVVAALEQEDDTKRKRISRLVPWWMSSAFAEFAGVRGSAIHRHLKDKERVYYRWKLTKPLA